MHRKEVFNKGVIRKEIKVTTEVKETRCLFHKTSPGYLEMSRVPGSVQKRGPYNLQCR